MKTHSRRSFLHNSACAAAGLFGAACQAPAISRPNILMIIVDQMSGLTTDFTGNHRWVKTPAMDSLASGGVRFTQSYCPYPLCSPSRSAMFTGRWVHETGVTVNTQDTVYRQSLPRLGDVFQAQGYRTAYFGKDHSGGTARAAFQECGTEIKGHGVDGDTARAEQCIDFLRRNTAQPFLAVLSLLNPHDICGWIGEHDMPQTWPDSDTLPPLLPNLSFTPAVEPEYRTLARTGWGENFRTAQAADWKPDQFRAYLAAYYRFVELVDAEIERVLDVLDATGLDENTMVVFTSDHGDGMGAHYLTTKPHQTEETIRVPCIIRWKHEIPAGVIDAAHLISGIDIFPTLCDCAGIQVPEGLRGLSLKSIIDNPSAPWRDALVCQETGARTYRTGRYKYIRFAYGARNEALFDLRTDPGEMGNLIEDAVMTGVLEQCRTGLDQWMRQTGDAFALTNVPQRGAAPPG